MSDTNDAEIIKLIEHALDGTKHSPSQRAQWIILELKERFAIVPLAEFSAMQVAEELAAEIANSAVEQSEAVQAAFRKWGKLTVAADAAEGVEHA